MAQLEIVNQPAPVLLPLLASVCLMVGLVVGLLGIKIWWFKHRLTFDQHATQNGTAGNRQIRFNSTQRSNSRLVASSSSLQVDGAVQIHGVFRKRQEDEWDIDRPAVLPPVRLSKSTSDLKLLTRAPNDESAIYGPPPNSKAPSIPLRKRKEFQSSTLAELSPPTREPPKPPPQDSLDAFVQSANYVEEGYEVTEPLLPTQPPPEAQSEHSTSPAISRANQDMHSESQQTKFIRAKAPGVEADTKKLSQRRVTGFLPPDLDQLRAMAVEDVVESLQPGVSGAESVTLRSNRNSTNGIEAVQQRERCSYVEYEKVDEFDASLDYLLKKKWETVATSESVDHHEPTDLQFLPTPVERHNETNPQITPDLFGELEDTNVDRTVEHLWLRIEQNNEQNLDTNFHMIRHSYEMNEADILDVRQEAATSSQGDALVVTTPAGFGKSIDEDWDNFENLSVMTSAEQIFEPRMEQIDVTPDRNTPQLDALFQNLEMPLPFEPIQQEGATAIFIENDNEGTEVAETKLPDYESLMAHDPAEFLLPDYEAAMQFETRFNSTKKTINYVSSIEDLYDELQQDVTGESHTQTPTDTAYITNIDELYEDLGIAHKPSVRYPTESYLDAKSDALEATLFGGGLAEGSLAAPQPAQRRTKTRMKVRFDMESSQYYQPDELEPESDSETRNDDAPKPKQRTTRLFIHDDDEARSEEEAGRQAPILLASYLTHNHNKSNNEQSGLPTAESSWQAMSRHRAMTSKLQEGSDEMPRRRELPRPAYRNPLAQTLVDNNNKPVAAVRKTSSSSSAGQSDTRQPPHAIADADDAEA